LLLTLIARLIGKSPTSVAREVKQNRNLNPKRLLAGMHRSVRACICARCQIQNTVARCEVLFCQDVCQTHLYYIGCKATAQVLWVYNAYRKGRYGCNREGRYRYEAAVADELSKRTSKSIAMKYRWCTEGLYSCSGTSSRVITGALSERNAGLDCIALTMCTVTEDPLLCELD
jgi:hypothetical protein